VPRLLIVDDSPLMRKLLGAIFATAGDFTVEFARDGAEALEKLELFKPDVITLDIQMPRMDGLACLDRIMLTRPCPVVMVSALSAEGAAVTLEALERGAVDFIAKPKGAVSLEIDALAPSLVETVRSAAKARLRPTLRLTERIRRRNSSLGVLPDRPVPRPTAAVPRRAAAESATADFPGLVLVGTSTGGPPALDALLSGLPADFPWPMIIAQHMPASFTGALAKRLNGLCALTVTELQGLMPLEIGHVYVAKGDADIVVDRRAGRPVVMPVPSSPAYRWHPSVDRLVESAIRHVDTGRLAGILMTGMGNDGAASMARLLELGGHTIAEAERTAVVWGMPGELVKRGGAAAVAPVDEIADALLDFMAQS
jgi:two-component system chemotaxis response regulator CheB